ARRGCARPRLFGRARCRVSAGGRTRTAVLARWRKRRHVPRYFPRCRARPSPTAYRIARKRCIGRNARRGAAPGGSRYWPARVAGRGCLRLAAGDACASAGAPEELALQHVLAGCIRERGILLPESSKRRWRYGLGGTRVEKARPLAPPRTTLARPGKL